MIPSPHRALVSAFVTVFLLTPAVLAVEAYWVGGPTGTWSDPANWSTGGVPDEPPLTNVTIDANSSQDTTVSLNQHVDVVGLRVDQFDTLNVQAGIQATTDAVSVAGSINLGTNARLVASQYLWVEPTGHIGLTDTPTQAGATLQFSFSPFWNQGIVEGAGNIASPRFLANEGKIDANTDGEQLLVQFIEGSNTNYGEMLATSGGFLRLRGTSGIATATTLQNLGAGLVRAHAESQVLLENMTVQGGEISSVAGEDGVYGTMQFSSVLLNGVRLEGEIAGSRITFQNTIENNAIITPFFGNPFIIVSGSALLAGTGRIELRNGSVQAQSSNSPPTVINGITHTILGPGTIGAGSTPFRFVNRGLVEATIFGGNILQVNASTATIANAGKFRARDGATLVLASSGTNITFENFEGAKAGVIEADLDSTVQLAGNVTLRGGILRSIIPTEPGSFVAGKVTSLGSGTTSPQLKDLRLEGTIGDATSVWRLTNTIENTGQLRGREIYVDGTVSLTGGGTVRLDQFHTIRSGTNPVYLFNEDNLIAGRGSIETTSSTAWTFVNRGIVEASDPAGGFQVTGFTSSFSPTVINSGLMQATNGGTLSLQANVLNREGNIDGTIHADDAALVNIGYVTGGILSTAGTGLIRTGAGASGLLDVHNQGALHIQSSTSLGGMIRNDGTITTQSPIMIGGSIAQLAGTGTLSNTTSSLAITVGQGIATLFTHGTNHTIQGSGKIQVVNGVFINEGTIVPEGASSLVIDMNEGATMIQKGMLNVQGGQRLEVWTRSETFDNKGTLDVAGDIYIDRLSFGSLNVVNETGANIALRGSLRMDVTDNVANRTTLWNKPGASLTGKGTIDFVETGPVQGLLRNSGLIRPEGEVAELGRIYLDGDFQQDPTGVLEVNVAGSEPGEFDALILSGTNATLGGTLDVYPLATFDPPVGQQYTIIDTQGGGVAGVFGQFHAPALSGRWWSLSYLTDKVVLGIEPITADFNLDGVVDDSDLDDWRMAYLTGTNAADADGDGDSDGADFLAWQRQFGSGMTMVESVSIPEPSLLAALFPAWIVFLARCRQIC